MKSINPTVLVTILNISYQSTTDPIKENFTRQVNEIFTNEQQVICLLVNKELPVKYIMLINSRAKLTDKIVFIQYEAKLTNHCYMKSLVDIVNEET